MQLDASDKIFLKDVELFITIGVHAHERVRRQKVMLSVTLSTNVRKAAAADDLAYALDYEELKAELVALGERKHYKLIETFAEQVAQLVLQRTGCTAVWVCAAKEWALSHTRAVGVEIYRERTN